jgi:hypothetical protein
MMDSQRPAEPGSHAPHCVVWHAPNAPPPADLLAALAKRHVTLEFRTGPFAALAEACFLDRAFHAGQADPSGPGHGVILVLVRAHELTDAPEVVRAVELYAPRTRCWRYEPGASVQLAAVTSADLISGPDAPTPPATPEVVVTPAFRRAAPPPVPGAVRHPAQGRPPLRLAGEGVLPARPEEDDALAAPKVREDSIPGQPPEPPTASGRQVLSPDELAMLLGEDTLGKSQSDPPRRRTGDSK